MSTCLPLSETWTWAVMFAANALPCTVTETCSLSMSGIMTTEVMYCPGTCGMQTCLAGHPDSDNIVLAKNGSLNSGTLHTKDTGVQLIGTAWMCTAVRGST